MKRRCRIAISPILLLAGLVSAADAQDDLLSTMVGTWDVAQRIWTGPGAEPMVFPPAVARRRLIGDVFLEEVMETTGSNQDPFTRIAYMNYNGVNHRYEWVSMDTRAPQMMSERSASPRPRPRACSRPSAARRRAERPRSAGPAHSVPARPGPAWIVA